MELEKLLRLAYYLETFPEPVINPCNKWYSRQALSTYVMTPPLHQPLVRILPILFKRMWFFNDMDEPKLRKYKDYSTRDCISIFFGLEFAHINKLFCQQHGTFNNLPLTENSSLRDACVNLKAHLNLFVPCA